MMDGDTIEADTCDTRRPYPSIDPYAIRTPANPKTLFQGRQIVREKRNQEELICGVNVLEKPPNKGRRRAKSVNCQVDVLVRLIWSLAKIHQWIVHSPSISEIFDHFSHGGLPHFGSVGSSGCQNPSGLKVHTPPLTHRPNSPRPPPHESASPHEDRQPVAPEPPAARILASVLQDEYVGPNSIRET